MQYEKKFFNLKEEDEPFLQSLIKGKVKESLNLEYKGEMTNHVKLAKVVSSFANSSGGIIIFGIEEKDSLPVKLNPLESELGETIENVLLTSISRSITFKITSINSTIEKNKKYFVIYVPKSSSGPHMVTSKGECRYHKRAYSRKNFSSVPID
jgi:predicted HTH transcriptional regulator